MPGESSQRLEKRLQEILNLIQELPEWVCSHEEKENFRKRARSLESKIEELASSVLTIGLLGGTGVGKSTIINALAGEVISLASHRRPYTEEIILHAHEEIVIPSWILTSDVPSIVHRHASEKARNIIICDMPDFDSIELEHRKLVRNFLKNLDLLVWITSPEKYADEAFYDFLKETLGVKDPSNFYFVMNKIDLVTAGIEQLEYLAGSFMRYLSDNGIDNPRLFLISALEALQNEPSGIWNQWHIFEREIFRERELKEIREIKDSNLMRELEHLEQALGNAILICNDAVEHIRRIKREIHDFSPMWEVKGRRISETLFGKQAIEQVISSFYDRNCLKGAAFIIAQIFSKSGEENSILPIPESTIEPFVGLSDRLNRVLLFGSAKEPLVREISESYDPQQLWMNWRERALSVFEEERTRFKSKRSGFFVITQSVLYWGLVVVFVLSLGGARNIQERSFFGWFGDMVLRFFEKIFTLEGFGALLSLLILETVSGYLFFTLYRKNLQEESRRVIERLGERMVEIWKEVLIEIVERLNSMEEVYASWIERIPEKKR